MSNNVILNHFNNILAQSKVDIEKCVVYDNQYIIFEVKNFFEMKPENEELGDILTKYRIIFDSASNAVLFTPFFRLVQEILIFNYRFYCKAFNNGEKDTKLLYVLSQVFKQPCKDPLSLLNALKKANKTTVDNCKIRKLYDLNYSNLPNNFAGSTKINKKIFKMRGGNVHYQGTWVSFEYSRIILKLIGGFDVLENLVLPIFSYLNKSAFKSKFDEQQEKCQIYPFLLNKDSEIWREFTNVICQKFKLKEYKCHSRLGKKRGKYNKTKNIGDKTLSSLKVDCSDKETSVIKRNVNLKFKVKNRRVKTIEISLYRSASESLGEKTLFSVSNSRYWDKYLGEDGRTCFFNCSEKSLFVPRLKNDIKPAICASLLSVCTNQYNVLIKTESKLSINTLKDNVRRKIPESSRVVMMEISESLNNLTKGPESCKFHNIMETPFSTHKMPLKTNIKLLNFINEPSNGSKISFNQVESKHLLKNTSLTFPEINLENTDSFGSFSKRLLTDEITKSIVLDYLSLNTNSTVGENYNYTIRTKNNFEQESNNNSSLLSDITEEINSYFLCRENCDNYIYND